MLLLKRRNFNFKKEVDRSVAHPTVFVSLPLIRMRAPKRGLQEVSEQCRCVSQQLLQSTYEDNEHRTQHIGSSYRRYDNLIKEA